MPKITSMFAFVMQDKDKNDEGVITMNLGECMLPLVGADMARVESLIPVADEVARRAGKPYKILKFKLVEVIERDGF